jgi:flavodoxin
MKASVICYSKTGNTRKVAGLIAEVLGTEAKDVKKVKEFSPDGLLVVGSGTYLNKAGKGMLEFLQRLPSLKGKRAAIFGTSGEGEFEKSDGLNKMRSILEGKGAKIVGTFCCQGSLFFFFNRGHPSEDELEEAKKFAESLKKA